MIESTGLPAGKSSAPLVEREEREDAEVALSDRVTEGVERPAESRTLNGAAAGSVKSSSAGGSLADAGGGTDGERSPSPLSRLPPSLAGALEQILNQLDILTQVTSLCNTRVSTHFQIISTTITLRQSFQNRPCP